MRQYKFRGKRVDNGEWVFGSLVKGYDATYIVFEAFADDYKYGFDVVFIPVVPETVGQFTGMQDKNGREIYEWDVVQVYFYDSYKNYTYKFEKAQAWKDGKYHDDIKVVKFFSGSFVIWSDLIQDYRCFANLARPGECLEVIGNIYDNPELIKRTA